MSKKAELAKNIARKLLELSDLLEHGRDYQDLKEVLDFIDKNIELTQMYPYLKGSVSSLMTGIEHPEIEDPYEAQADVYILAEVQEDAVRRAEELLDLAKEITSLSSLMIKIENVLLDIPRDEDIFMQLEKYLDSIERELMMLEEGVEKVIAEPL